MKKTIAECDPCREADGRERKADGEVTVKLGRNRPLTMDVCKTHFRRLAKVLSLTYPPETANRMVGQRESDTIEPDQQEMAQKEQGTEEEGEQGEQGEQPQEQAG